MKNAPINSAAAPMKSLNDLPPFEELGVHRGSDEAEDREGHHDDDEELFSRLNSEEREQAGQVRRDVVGGDDAVRSGGPFRQPVETQGDRGREHPERACTSSFA